MSPISRHIHINGIVQGVGFRPFVYNLARSFNLTGWVRNSANGVDIEVTGEAPMLETFIRGLRESAPPLAQIDSITSKAINTEVHRGFNILSSENKAADFIPISPDVSICSQCQFELFNPEDRRFHYPFINCTNCGPRFTIIKDIPYDRPKTTMVDFTMCADCLEEYENPQDRRFHAQPIACPECGPQVWLEMKSEEIIATRESAIAEARRMLADGKILAIKGLGGFHLACNAKNGDAVQRMRELKKRPSKPFALMAFDLEAIAKYTRLSPAAKNLLASPQAPIVLLPQKSQTGLADSVAPGQSTLGFMLPYTPIHLLLLEKESGFPEVLVMTSGNLSEEPVIRDNEVAREKLSAIADAFLFHDRPIHMRIDDSVFSLINDSPYPVRRARGYAPTPIHLSETLPQILSVGPQMKNTFCLTRDRYAFISHHIGEMDNWETYQDFKFAIYYYQSLFRIQPQAIGYDLHPDYITTKYALERAAADGIPAYPIQHHHAHLIAGMIENDLAPEQKVAGLIFDGTGYGSDGTIWGGEVLVGNCLDYSRPFFLTPVPLPGGDVTIRKPARMALSTLWAYDLPWDETLAPVRFLSARERDALATQLDKGINAVPTSSMGRLFDAVSALIGIRQSVSYEAQAAIEMEGLADRSELGYYPWQLDEQMINVKPVLKAILTDLARGVTPPVISARFHNSIAQLSLALAQQIQQQFGIHQIVLSGGVWQNLVLLEKTIRLFKENGLQPLIHQQLPPNDGCVAFGQAIIAAYRYLQDKE